MKNKLFGIALMLTGLIVGGYLAVFIFVSKGLPVLFGFVIPYFAGKFIYAQSGPTNGVVNDAIAGIKAAFRRGEKVASGVKEAFDKN